VKEAVWALAAVARSATAIAAALRRCRKAKASATSASGQVATPVPLQPPVPATTQTAGSLREWQAPDTQKPPCSQSASAAQLVLQALAPQAYALQLDCCDAGQCPEPSQNEAAEATAFEQDAARHWLAPVGYAQAVRDDPSQEPPQADPSVAHAVRPPRGSPTTAPQTPALPATLQASHWPLQAVSQQTPSTQLPLAHCAALPQLAPAASREVQTPPEHQSPPLQSALVTQSPLQLAPLQT
jgi:hypothetical protein